MHPDPLNPSLILAASPALEEGGAPPIEDAIGLCLSGGGYRAMLFHLGTLWRLNESGYLSKVKRISSVSGGSITAGALAVAWKQLRFSAGAATNFDIVTAAVRTVGATSIDVKSVLGGILSPGSISDHVMEKLDELLFHGATLQDLPDQPVFIFNATNVQSGALWRFRKEYMWDWKVGKIAAPTEKLTLAVTASAAFPPVLSPLRMKLDPASFVPNTGDQLQREPFTSAVYLTDGGVYDNLGLETVWKRFRTVLVSDAGGLMAPDESPDINWASHSKRVLDLLDHQVRNLRKRQVVGSLKAKVREGAYWGIRTDIAKYQLADALPGPHARTMELAEISTRLKELDDETQERLINWGYAVCDAAMRKHVDPALPPGRFPYPRGV
ncbi:MAG TPA: patatin-like phospholipase family protein [Vicinamibacterales bacterium]|nr:patatin-like phospholipase family protein [Vicinamibacterales bacterium]